MSGQPIPPPKLPGPMPVLYVVSTELDRLAIEAEADRLAATLFIL